MKPYPIACWRCDQLLTEKTKDPWGQPRQLCAGCEEKVRAREQEISREYNSCPNCKGKLRADDHEFCGLCEDCCAGLHNLGWDAGLPRGGDGWSE